MSAMSTRHYVSPKQYSAITPLVGMRMKSDAGNYEGHNPSPFNNPDKTDLDKLQDVMDKFSQLKTQLFVEYCEKSGDAPSLLGIWRETWDNFVPSKDENISNDPNADILDVSNYEKHTSNVDAFNEVDVIPRSPNAGLNEYEVNFKKTEGHVENVFFLLRGGDHSEFQDYFELQEFIRSPRHSLEPKNENENFVSSIFEVFFIRFPTCTQLKLTV